MKRINKLFMIPVLMSLLSFAVNANAQVIAAPRLGIQMLSTGLTPNTSIGSIGTFGVVRLDTTYSSEDIRLTSLPVIVSAGNGATAASLNNCTVYNAGNPSVALNSGGNVQSSALNGLNTFVFNSALVLPRGTVTTLNVQCTLASNAVAGGTYQMSINTANVIATGNVSGMPAIVSVGTGLPVETIPPVIGLPNTGAGGMATTNVALLLGSLVALTLGFAYARKTSR